MLYSRLSSLPLGANLLYDLWYQRRCLWAGMHKFLFISALVFGLEREYVFL